MTRPHLPCPPQVAAHEWRRATEYTAALIARRHRLLPWWADGEQVALEGWLALWRAGRDWDPARRVSIVTYAGKLVQGALHEIIRRSAPCGRTIFEQLRKRGEMLPQPLSLDTHMLGDPHEDGGDLTLADTLVAPEPLPEAAPLFDAEMAQALALLAGLTPMQQEAVIAKLGGGNLSALARQRGILKQSMYSAAVRGLEKLKRQARERIEEAIP